MTPTGRAVRRPSPAHGVFNGGLDNGGLDNGGLDNEGLDNEGLEQCRLNRRIPGC
jgi:hypothetical protein